MKYERDSRRGILSRTGLQGGLLGIAIIVWNTILIRGGASLPMPVNTAFIRGKSCSRNINGEPTPTLSLELMNKSNSLANPLIWAGSTESR
jgi:hypothetical protein